MLCDFVHDKAKRLFSKMREQPVVKEKYRKRDHGGGIIAEESVRRNH